MKIGIVTIHRANNYGAVLQATATGIYLKKYGDVFYIHNNDSHYLEEQLNLVRFSFSIRGILRSLKDILRIKNRYYSLNKFKSHFQKYYTELDVQHDINEIRNLNVLVCGSDQIWNPQCTNGNDNINGYYFLDFSGDETTLFSYASSAGSYQYDDKQLSKVKYYLDKFKKIGVREIDLSSTLNKKINLNSQVVLDPTLLLNKEDWDKLPRERIKNLPQKYIFVYVINHNVNTNSIIKDISSKYDLKIVSLTQEVSPNHNAHIYIKNVGPLGLIELIQKSNYVVTDSFHGCCMSLTYEKQFSVIHPGKEKINRISSLFDALNIMDNNILNNKMDIDNIIDIDYRIINNNLLSLRNSSTSLIDEAMAD
ncbi:MAG: polysaccharide pyruvyl transferase family protein [Providencia heimbachae]|nr:polysaccharide pyruvyl transferase family protein [Providencia heimbachae]